MTRVLDRIAEQLPTDNGFVTTVASEVVPTAARPFGMRLAVEPAVTATVDVGSLRWDDDKQIMMLADGADLSPAFKHTSTETGTSTNSQDRSAPDTDKDASGS
jgi:putative ATP-grasp target RiPP